MFFDLPFVLVGMTIGLEGILGEGMRTLGGVPVCKLEPFFPPSSARFLRAVGEDGEAIFSVTAADDEC